MKKAWVGRLFCVLSAFFVLGSLGAGALRQRARNYGDIIKMLKNRARQRMVTPFIQAFFPPYDKVKPLICGLIEEETERIDVEAFQLTNRDIAASLLDAHYRGVDVQLVVDVGALGRFSKVLPLYNAGVSVFVYPEETVSEYTLMHNKIMLFYSLSCIITGSMNFTNAGMDKNRENLIVIQNQELFDEYAYQFRTLLKQTTPLGKAHKELSL
jgi:phosphatidylserine/phosphatidylglycerophosphate/cardiolipin synthase-like enzyme